MNTDDVVEQATKVMHAEVCCPCDPQGCNWVHTPEARYARALADAGLLARPLPAREQVADAILEAELRHRPPGIGGQVVPAIGDRHLAVADAVLALLEGTKE